MMVIALLFILLPAPCCDTNEWNGITPLKSARGDVEKILGKPLHFSSNMSQYKTKNENVMVVYAEKPCGGMRELSRETSPDALVVVMEVNPITRPKLSDYKLEPAKFQKTIDELKNQAIYSDVKDGITIVEDATDHTVVQFGYTPEKSFAEEYCKRASSH